MRLMKLFLAVCLLSTLVACDNKKDIESREITVYITVEDMTTSEVLYDGEVSATGSIETLEDLLELVPELEVEMSKGAYGVQIDSILGRKTENWSKGPWWVFSSDNNTSCVEMGMCPAISEVIVEEQDSFKFEFIQ